MNRSKAHIGKKLRTWRIVLGLLSATLLFLPSCNVDELDFDGIKIQEYTPELAVPLGYVNYSFADIVEDLDDTDVILEEQPDRSLVFIYRDTTEFTTSADFIDVGTVSNEATINPKLDVINNTNSEMEVPFSRSFTFEFNAVEDEEIDSIFFSGGLFVLELSSRFRSDLAYRITVEETRNVATNQPVVFDSRIRFSNILPIVARSTRELDGLKTILNRGTTGNIFNVQFDGTLILQPGQTADPSDFVNFSLIFRNPEFDLLYGKFGRKEVSIENTVVEFNFFEELGSQGFEFENAQIMFGFENGYGIPIGLDLSQMSVLTLDGDSIPLAGEVSDDFQLIDPAPIEPLGEVAVSEVLIRPSNSNISEMVNATPKQFNLNLSAISNPFDTTQINFYRESSKINAYFELNIPMDIRVRELTKTIDYKLDSLDFDEADSLYLRFFTVNALPVEASFDIEILNSDSVVVQRQTDVAFAEAPRFGAVGLIGGATTAISEVGLGAETIAALQTGIKIYITINVNSSGLASQQYVTIFTTSSIELQVALRGSFRIKL